MKSSRRLVLLSLLVVSVAAVAQASTWTVYPTNHQPEKDGVPQGSAQSGPLQLDYVMRNGASDDTIVIKPGVYDLGELTPLAVPNYAYCHLVAKNADGSVRAATFHFRGENKKPWNAKTAAEETILRGNGTATICYAHAGSGRPSSYQHLTFENGKRVQLANTGTYGGGAISHAQTEQIRYNEHLSGCASNCVFRNCSSEYTGGATYGVDAYNSLFTNCTAATQGGGAYGFCGANSGPNHITNRFDRSVFVCCAAQSGGGIFAREMHDLTDASFLCCTGKVGSSGDGGGIAAFTGANQISGCRFENCYTYANGVAIMARTNVNRIVDCTFVGNRMSSTGNGGAVFVRSDPQVAVLGAVENCTFRENWAGWGGGALFADYIGEVKGCVFRDNRSHSSGPAIYSGHTLDRVDGCVFVGNVSTNEAGCVRTAGRVGEVTDSAFTNNVANTFGGALDAEGGFDRIAGCTFVGNASQKGGGAVRSVGALGAVANCTFEGNSANNGDGGALFAMKALGSVSGSTFVGNESVKGLGGAVAANEGVGMVDGCTFSENAAGGGGSGGVHLGVQSGDFAGCAFHSNTNKETLYGAHVNQANSMTRCTFSGYGDICAKNYDSCEFDHCVYQYCERNYGSDAHGLLSYPNNIGDGRIVNCLMHDCLVSRFIASAGVRTDVINCTFADNTADDNHPQKGKGHAIQFFAFRGGEPLVASTNVMINCIFCDNHVVNNDTIKFDPCDAFFQGSATTRLGHTEVSNCLYKTAYYFNSGTGEHSHNFNKGDPKFVTLAWKWRYPKAPYYMIRRSSNAIGKGLVLDWMMMATDLLGAPMVRDGRVDLGCYQCTLPTPGMAIFLRDVAE